MNMRCCESKHSKAAANWLAHSLHVSSVQTPKFNRVKTCIFTSHAAELRKQCTMLFPFTTWSNLAVWTEVSGDKLSKCLVSSDFYMSGYAKSM